MTKLTSGASVATIVLKLNAANLILITEYRSLMCCSKPQGRNQVSTPKSQCISVISMILWLHQRCFEVRGNVRASYRMVFGVSKV